MAYEQMLQYIVEHHKQNEGISQKVYRYAGLIHAIEFFSQKFNLNHLEKYIYEFTNELLLPDQIAVFIRKQDKYILLQSSGYKKTDYTVDYNSSYDEIIKYYSGLLKENNLKEYLEEKVFEDFDFQFCIPLNMDFELYGFIFVNKMKDNFSEDDEIIANALMNLFSTALSNYKYYNDLENVSRQLNEKIFNLFAINHSSKALLSQLDLETLYELSISAFAELTQSSFTAFFLYDPISRSYNIVGLKDVYDSDLILYINLCRSGIDTKLRVLTDMSDENQRDDFYNMFENSREILKDLNISYVVSLLKKNELIGFVLLGPKVNDTDYDNSIFELIESLASSIYIAINNAKNFKKINMENKIINNKLKRIVKVDQLMKNINTASNIDQLIKLTLNTLNIYFGVTSGFVGLIDDKIDAINIVESINMDKDLEYIPFTKELEVLKSGKKIILNSEADIESIFTDDIIKGFNNTYSGGLFVPIFVEDNELKLLGVIGILAIRDKILGDEENIITIESIANHIAPVMYQFITLKKIISQYKPDYQSLFLQDLKHDIIEAENFYLELKIIHIIIDKEFIFDKPDIESLCNMFEKVYPIDNTNVFVITIEKDPMKDIDKIIGKNSYCKQYEYGKDFNNLEQFISIYSNKQN